MRNTLQEQYNLIKKGKGAKDSFLKNAKELYPNLIRNAATFNEATQILKNKSVISENIWGVVQHDNKKLPDWFKIFNENIQDPDQEYAFSSKELTVKSSITNKSIMDIYNMLSEIDDIDFIQEIGIIISRKDWDNRGQFANKQRIYKEIQKHLNDKNIINDLEEELYKQIKKSSSKLNEAKAEEKKPTKEVVDMETRGYDYKDPKNIDNVFGEEFLKGYYTEMKDPKNSEKTVDELKQIVAKNLAKDKLHYVKDDQFGTKGVGYVEDHPGLGKPKEAKGKYKSSGYGTLKENQEQKLTENYMISKSGSKTNPSYVIEKTDGSEQIDMFFDSEEKAKEYADKKGLKISPKKGYNMEESLDENNITGPEWNSMDVKSRIKLLRYHFPKLSLKFADWKWDDLTPMIKKELTSKSVKESLNEGYGMSLEDAKAEAKRISREEGVVQHVEETEEGSGKYKVSDWYDSDLTVASYEDGMSLNENKNPMIKLTKILNETEYYLSYKKDKKGKLKEKKETPKKVSTQVKNIEQAGNVAALEAKMNAVDEEISSRETKIRMATENEDLAYFVNPEKIKEAEKEIKELKKAKEKYSKMYEKLTGSKKKEIIDEKEEE
jgi:hypothetical protein